MLPALSLLLLCVSCETTTSNYGYYVEGLTDDSIRLLFEISDQAVLERDFVTYESLFGPMFRIKEEADRGVGFTNLKDYMENVESIFKNADYMEITTIVTDIQYDEMGESAIVTITEDERRKVFGNTQHFSSMSEMEVRCEDGWIFFASSKRVAVQVIDQ